jgi:pimeloyl-ACP methyl ester carboxylesterase
MENFRVEIPQAQLDDLHRRLDTIRWPDPLPGTGWERGVPTGYLRELVEYWRTSYDWRAAEARLNELPQFTTEIDGANVHFVHVRSPEPDAVPMVISHGWPGSFVELLDVIGPLTDPRAYGADPDMAFHLVIPTLPGFGFSGPVRAGFGTVSTAQAWGTLMAELGYDRYIAQGADFGSGVALAQGMLDAEHVCGVHINELVTSPRGDTDGLSEDDQARMAKLERFRKDLGGSMKLHATRPNTVSCALHDSPMGQLAYIVEKYKDWADAPNVPEDGVSRDTILTIAMIYWLTGTAGSSAQFYYETGDWLPINEGAGHYDGLGAITAPIGVAVYPESPFGTVRRFADREFDTIVHWNEFDRGGHFAAAEEPDLFIEDLRAFGRLLKK